MMFTNFCTGTEITTPKEDPQSVDVLQKKQSSDLVRPEVEAVGHKVAMVNIGITPAENPQPENCTKVWI